MDEGTEPARSKLGSQNAVPALQPGGEAAGGDADHSRPATLEHDMHGGMGQDFPRFRLGDVPLDRPEMLDERRQVLIRPEARVAGHRRAGSQMQDAARFDELRADHVAFVQSGAFRRR